jgi:hypothetical protein
MTKGSYKYQLFVEKFPRFIFDYFEKLVDRIQRLTSEDHNRTKAFLQSAREGEEGLRATIKEYENLLVETQKDRD